MKKADARVQRFIEGTILFGLSPLLGLVLIFASIAILVGSIQKDALATLPLIFSGAFLLVGLGLLQFSYLVFFKKESRISNGVIYLASVFFMALGIAAAVYLFVVPPSDVSASQAFQYGRAPGVFFVGLLGFMYARKRRGRTSRPRQLRSALRADHRV